MKVLISTSASKLPELDGVYLLRERKQFIKQGKTVNQWETHEKPVKVVALRGQKVMIKNAFGNKTNVKAKGIDINSIGAGKQFKFLPYEKPKKTSEDRNSENTDKIIQSAKVKALKEKQKQLRKELAEIDKLLLKMQKESKLVEKKKMQDDSYQKLAKFIMKKS
jgi:hypothetical protein